MASRSHFMIDALQYLADPQRSAHSARDERAAVAARAEVAGDRQRERRHSGRHAAILLALLVAVLLLGLAA